MMKSVEPKADLPPASSSTMLTYSALPVRRPYHQPRESPRNMTGVYLSQDPYGLPSNKFKQQRIPPLAKQRGSVYQPRTQPGYLRQQRRQDLMVRSRGEAKAFQPLPIKRAKPKGPRHEYHGPSPHVIGPKPDFHAVTRKSARSRVPASNDGVTHFEDLRSNSSGNSSDKATQEAEVIESMLDSISLASKESEKSLAGLVECYKKICKGNTSSVHNLMTSRVSPSGKHKRKKGQINNGNTPLLIRSFRNPQHPHAVVQYSNPKDRTASPQGSGRPPVPAPYFYSSKGLPQTSDEGGNRVKLSRLPVCYMEIVVSRSGATSRGPDSVLAAPGAGSMSRSNSRTTGSTRTNHRPPNGIEGTRPPSLHTNAKIIDSDSVYMIKENFHVPASTPVASTVDMNRMSEIDPTDHRSTDLSQRHQVVTLPGSHAPGSITSSAVGPTSFPNGTSVGGDIELTSVTGDSVELESKPDTQGRKESIAETVTFSITISVEDDSGQLKTMDLDEEAGTQLTGTGNSEGDVSASEVAEKQKESQAKKQAELDQLLEEHHQIVSQIEELEKIKGSTGDSAEEEEMEAEH
ncbi:uncharacterized protein LOC129264455 isoform X2 [Lytechinus pictus]|uniref:uncharacterized protein LOC129264455 isoform X2 n=1 Tax=Lytechinus pictus TaxID=7653 RepID=UPI0030BA0AF2